MNDCVDMALVECYDGDKLERTFYSFKIEQTSFYNGNNPGRLKQVEHAIVDIENLTLDIYKPGIEKATLDQMFKKEEEQ